LRDDLDELLTCFRYKSQVQRRAVRTTDVLDKGLVVFAAVFSRTKDCAAARATARVKRALPRNPTGIRRRFRLPLKSTGDRAAKSGEEDVIPTPLPFIVAPRLRRLRTPLRLAVLCSAATPRCHETGIGSLSLRDKRPLGVS